MWTLCHWTPFLLPCWCAVEDRCLTSRAPPGRIADLIMSRSVGHGVASARHWAIPSWPASVQRNISQVLDHGNRPTPCSERLDFPHLLVDSLLPLHDKALLDVAFHSQSSRTNWGRRHLNGKEIAGATDSPL
jgi:hypothetical protein